MTTITTFTTTTAARLRQEHRPLAHRVVGAGFDVRLHVGSERAARVVPGRDRLCVVVADRPDAGTPIATDLPTSATPSSCVVWCHDDGGVQVRASWAPPALLVCRDHTTMVPETPGQAGLVRMEAGDRLLVLSSAAYEAAAERMVHLLHSAPHRLLAVDADSILATVFADVPDAAGAVITRLG